jgi:phenylalanine-4-hydroxylase
VAVPGLIPDDVFFDLANRRFPVTCGCANRTSWTTCKNRMCSMTCSAMCPLLMNPVFADYL